MTYSVRSDHADKDKLKWDCNHSENVPTTEPHSR